MLHTYVEYEKLLDKDRKISNEDELKLSNKSNDSA